MKVLLLCLLSCLTVPTEAQQSLSCNRNYLKYLVALRYADIIMKEYQSHLNRIETSIIDMKHSLKRNAEMERMFYVSKKYRGSYYLARRSWYNRLGSGLIKANRVCKEFGGHLLKINKQSELDYVASFLSSIPLKTYFFTGKLYSWPKGWYFYNEETLTQLRVTQGRIYCSTISNRVSPAKLDSRYCISEGTYICEIAHLPLENS